MFTRQRTGMVFILLPVMPLLGAGLNMADDAFIRGAVTRGCVSVAPEFAERIDDLELLRYRHETVVVGFASRVSAVSVAGVIMKKQQIAGGC
jgi:hypothetical protein